MSMSLVIVEMNGAQLTAEAFYANMKASAYIQDIVLLLTPLRMPMHA